MMESQASPVPKPDCAVCNQPYHRHHQNGVRRICPVYASYRPKETQPVADEQGSFEPCPTCKQYSHSIGGDQLADAFMHFETLLAHPVRGHAMGPAFDEKTRDAAQVLVAAARGCDVALLMNVDLSEDEIARLRSLRPGEIYPVVLAGEDVVRVREALKEAIGVIGVCIKAFESDPPTLGGMAAVHLMKEAQQRYLAVLGGVDSNDVIAKSREIDPEAWGEADAGRHTRENNARLERANDQAREQIEKARILAIAETLARPPFQDRVQPWMMECFGPEISGDREERNHRFLEESLELVQACGCTASEAHQLVDYVFGRPVGEKGQEVGGVRVTLAALCLAHELSEDEEAERELARIWTKVEQIRAKQAAKPKHSPLPETSPSLDKANS